MRDNGNFPFTKNKKLFWWCFKIALKFSLNETKHTFCLHKKTHFRHNIAKLKTKNKHLSWHKFCTCCHGDSANTQGMPLFGKPLLEVNLVQTIWPYLPSMLSFGNTSTSIGTCDARLTLSKKYSIILSYSGFFFFKSNRAL